MARCSRELRSGGEFRSGEGGGGGGEGVQLWQRWEGSYYNPLFTNGVSEHISLAATPLLLPFPVSPTQFTFLRKRKIGGLKIPLLFFDFPGL